MTTTNIPASLDAERAALGAALIDPSAFKRGLVDVLTDADFFLPAHRAIFQAMSALVATGAPIDYLTVADELKARGSLSRLEGGEAYLVELGERCPSTANVEHYVEIVREKANLRRLIEHLSASLAAAQAADADPAEVAEEAQRGLSRIVVGRDAAAVRIGTAMGPFIESLEERARIAMEHGGTPPINGITFKVSPLDEMIAGLKPGDQCFLAAEPGVGKTALALQTADENVKEEGASLIFSFEMMVPQIAERLVVRRGRVDGTLVRRGTVQPDDWRAIHKVAADLARPEANLYVDTTSRSFREMAASARRWAAKHAGKRLMIVVDFLQKARLDLTRQSKAQAIGDLAYDLKGLAMELGASNITVSALKREASATKLGREGEIIRRPPNMNDLKESGDLEYSADQVVLLYSFERVKIGMINGIVAKSRHTGAEGEFGLYFDGRYQLFSDPPPGSGYQAA